MIISSTVDEKTNKRDGSITSVIYSSSFTSSITRVNSTVEELLVYIYDLSPLDLDVLFLLIKHNRAMTLEELSAIADRDKSNVFRSLQRLVALGICAKETRTMKEGGYHHLYSAIDIKSFKIQTQKKVKELEESFHRLLRKFEVSMQEVVETVYKEEDEEKQ